MNRLVLIDGNAILHRAYHAIPPLTAPDGSVVNAVYGFGSMLLRLITDLKPTHVAVAFDRAKPTFRKKIFAGYQAKRPKMDDALVEQIPKVHALVAAFGIPIFEKDGFEADDVIGTLCKKFTNPNSQFTKIDQVIIVTGDRDILQLVEDDKVLVYMPVKGLSQSKLFDEKAVVERMGVAPKLIPDYKALAGDASDNYPGVPGIGPKTAVALLTKYKTIAGVLKHHTFTKEEQESARMSHDLATIRTSVLLSGALVPLGSLNQPEAVTVLTTLGFRTMLKRITGDTIEEKPTVVKTLAGKQESLF
jgi:DNA polymerase-1